MEFPYFVGQCVVDGDRSVLVGLRLREMDHAAVELRNAKRLALVPSRGRRQAQFRNQKRISILPHFQCGQQRTNLVVVEVGQLTLCNLELAKPSQRIIFCPETETDRLVEHRAQVSASVYDEVKQFLLFADRRSSRPAISIAEWETNLERCPLQ